MTNEEKATELGIKYQTPCHGVGDCEFEARQAALEMAEWKEEQMIDKACEWLKENIHKYKEYDESGFYHEKSKFLFKDFKKAMEE